MISESHFSPIAALDLDLIKSKLIAQPGGAWSSEKATAVEHDYRQFLYQMKMFPNEQAAPLPDVDLFWRFHILETRSYAADCERAFGYFLHRSPYLRPRSEGEKDVMRRCSNSVTAQ